MKFEIGIKVKKHITWLPSSDLISKAMPFCSLAYHSASDSRAGQSYNYIISIDLHEFRFVFTRKIINTKINHRYNYTVINTVRSAALALRFSACRVPTEWHVYVVVQVDTKQFAIFTKNYIVIIVLYYSVVVIKNISYYR